MQGVVTLSRGRDKGEEQCDPYPVQVVVAKLTPFSTMSSPHTKRQLLFAYEDSLKQEVSDLRKVVLQVQQQNASMSALLQIVTSIVLQDAETIRDLQSPAQMQHEFKTELTYNQLQIADMDRRIKHMQTTLFSLHSAVEGNPKAIKRGRKTSK
eukprot:764581-Hanusia_phi.AAC.15